MPTARFATTSKELLRELHKLRKQVRIDLKILEKAPLRKPKTEHLPLGRDEER